MLSFPSRVAFLKKFFQMLPVISLSIFLIGLFQIAAAAEAEQATEVPAQVQSDHWACKEIAELCDVYRSAERLPAMSVVTRRELARTLLSVLEKVAEKYQKDGADAIPRVDLERIAKLEAALRNELSEFPGYLQRRETIEQMLAKPEEPPFMLRLGVNGFLRGEGAGNFNLRDFSYTPDHSQGRFVYRVKPYAYWHPTDYLDFHLEGQGYGYAGERDLDNSHYSLYQGFLEARLPDREWLALKGGRQEFSYGSTFVLGPNSFFDGLVFDAGRLRIKPADPLTVDLLAGAYATPFSNGFKGNLFGGYASYVISDGNAVDAYLFRDTGSVLRHPGEELLIWGVRGTAKVGSFELEFEPVYETGAVFSDTIGGNERINAYGGHLDVSYGTALAGRDSRTFLSYALGSGSTDAANGVSSAREFRNPDNDSSLVGDMNLVGDLSGLTINGHHASGLQIYTLGWGIDVTKDVNFSATGHYFLANHVEGNFSRSIGVETDFTLTCRASDEVSLVIGYDHFFSGGFVQDAAGSGGDIDYGYFMLQFDLSRSWLKKKPVRPKHGQL